MTRRHFLRSALVLAMAILLELFGLKKTDPPSNHYKFNLGCAQLKIEPHETFTARIRWPGKVYLSGVLQLDGEETA